MRTRKKNPNNLIKLTNDEFKSLLKEMRILLKKGHSIDYLNTCVDSYTAYKKVKFGY